MKKKYSYLHIVYQDGGGKFLSALINGFICQECDTNIKDHLWVTWDKELFDMFYGKADILFEKASPISAINKYGKNVNWIFIHGLSFPPYKLLLIKPWLCKKIIWRTWGHDIAIPKRGSANFLLKKIYRGLNYRVLKHKAKKFKFIGIGNIVDELKIKRAFGDKIKVIELPYFYGQKESKSKIVEAINKLLNKENNDMCCRVMVGHSGHDCDNHIEILKRLAPYFDENLFIYIMLPYGDSKYSLTVKEYASKNLGKKYQVIDKTTSFFDYINFLCSVDVAIFDMENSAALGNISLLLTMGKKIFLRKNGDIFYAFEYCGIKCNVTEEIGNIDFAVFKSPVIYEKDTVSKFSSLLENDDYETEKWNSIFNLLRI